MNPAINPSQDLPDPNLRVPVPDFNLITPVSPAVIPALPSTPEPTPPVQNVNPTVPEVNPTDPEMLGSSGNLEPPTSVNPDSKPSQLYINQVPDQLVKSLPKHPSLQLSSVSPSLTSSPALCSTSTPLLPALKIASLAPNIKDLMPQDQSLSKSENESIIMTPLKSTKGGGKRGRKKKTTAPQEVVKEPSQCDHFSEEENQEKFDDYKSLSRSFSSIKQRLKTLAKDMCTPVRKVKAKDENKFASPLTMKIMRSSDGGWVADPSPVGKLVLRISNSGRNRTPKLKIKPLARNCKTEKPCRIKISLKRNPEKSSKSEGIEYTPKTRYVPEGWVSFEEVQSKLDKPEPCEDEIKIIHESNVKSLATIKKTPTRENKDVNIKDEKIEVKPQSASISPVSCPSSGTKPKISLRTDLFAVKEEKPTPNPDSSILLNKLSLGRRNLMDTIGSLSDKKGSENKLVVLNPVTEDLDDIIEVGRQSNDVNDDIIDVSDLPDDDTDDIVEICSKPATEDDDIIIETRTESRPNNSVQEKIPFSCFCCPTIECRNKPANPVPRPELPAPVAPQEPVVEEPENPVSQLDQAIASISNRNLSMVNHSTNLQEKVASIQGGVGFVELDQAIASIAELQTSLLGSRESDFDQQGSPFFQYDMEEQGNSFEEILCPNQDKGDAILKN